MTNLSEIYSPENSGDKSLLDYDEQSSMNISDNLSLYSSDLDGFFELKDTPAPRSLSLREISDGAGFMPAGTGDNSMDDLQAYIAEVGLAPQQISIDPSEQVDIDGIFDALGLEKAPVSYIEETIEAAQPENSGAQIIAIDTLASLSDVGPTDGLDSLVWQFNVADES
jgi:hypothetical protein